MSRHKRGKRQLLASCFFVGSRSRNKDRHVSQQASTGLYLIISVSPHVASWRPVADTVIPILYIRTLRLRELSDLLTILKLEEAEWAGPSTSLEAEVEWLPCR